MQALNRAAFLVHRNKGRQAGRGAAQDVDQRLELGSVADIVGEQNHTADRSIAQLRDNSPNPWVLFASAGKTNHDGLADHRTDTCRCTIAGVDRVGGPAAALLAKRNRHEDMSHENMGRETQHGQGGERHAWDEAGTE